MTIGENIKRIRKERGLSQKELGERLHMTQSAIWQFESDKTSPKSETIKKIANALGVTPFELVGPEWADIQVGPEKAKELYNVVAIQDGIVAVLREIYGAVKDKEPIGEYGTGHYYLVGKAPNTFILHDGDIDALAESTKASIPALVERLKDTRPEEEIIREYVSELNQPFHPEK